MIQKNINLSSNIKNQQTEFNTGLFGMHKSPFNNAGNLSHNNNPFVFTFGNNNNNIINGGNTNNNNNNDNSSPFNMFNSNQVKNNFLNGNQNNNNNDDKDNFF